MSEWLPRRRYIKFVFVLFNTKTRQVDTPYIYKQKFSNFWHFGSSQWLMYMPILFSSFILITIQNLNYLHLQLDLAKNSRPNFIYRHSLFLWRGLLTSDGYERSSSSIASEMAILSHQKVLKIILFVVMLFSWWNAAFEFLSKGNNSYQIWHYIVFLKTINAFFSIYSIEPLLEGTSKRQQKWNREPEQ